MNKYTEQLIKLQPPGLALPSHADSNWVRLLDGFGSELERIDACMDGLVENILLQGGSELLNQWEQALGLPDACTKGLESVTDDLRRARIRTKLADTGRADKAYFIELAEELGVTATVIESKPFYVGQGRMGDAVGGYDNLLVWRMDFQSPISSEQFTMLKCIVRHNKPAETHVIFSIDGVPEDITAGYNYHEMRIEVWAGELHTLPADRLVCDGSRLSALLYPSLFKWLGYSYSEWDETDPVNKDYFRLPDLRGRTILGTTSDAEVGDYQEDKVMWHEHPINTASPYKLNGLGGFRAVSANHAGKKAATENSWSYVRKYDGPNGRVDTLNPETPHHRRWDTRMKNISVHFVVKAQPFFYTNVVGVVAFNPCKRLTRKALNCDGSEVGRLEYSHLFDVIGETYGAGDGSSTFNLPNIDDIYIRGTALGSAVDPDRESRVARPDGEQGDVPGSMQGSSLRSHNHGIKGAAWGGLQGVNSFWPAKSATIEAKGFLNFNPKNTNRTVAGGELDKDAAWSGFDGFSDKNYMRALKMRAVIFYEA